MEHIPSPHGLETVHLDRVRLLTSKGYDKGLFLTYPSRCALPPLFVSTLQTLHELRHEEEAFDMVVPTMPSKAECECFLQEWLFFGILHEFLLNAYCYEDYVTMANPAPASNASEMLPDKYISTAKLSQILSAKLIAEWNAAGLIASELVAHLGSCLRIAYRALFGIRDWADRSKISLDYNLILSLGSVLEVLDDCLKDATQSRPEPERHNPIPWHYLSDHSLGCGKMDMLNWCPYMVNTIFRKEYIHLNTRIYLSRLHRGRLSRDHQECVTESCKAHNIDEQRYKTSHRYASCNCQYVGPSSEEIAQLLAEGTFPLCRLRKGPGTNDVVVEVVPYSPTSRFTAFSHVWSDGLGNPTQNSLPLCQIEYLQSMATELENQVERIQRTAYSIWCWGACRRWRRRHAGRLNSGPRVLQARENCFCDLRRSFYSNSTRHGLFWIDTLCCPVRNEPSRGIALKKIQDVYNDAEGVLVLDSSIINVAAQALSHTEIIARMRSCGWTTRLWTLQEASLAHDLWFRFSDRAVSYFDLWLHAETNSPNDLVERVLYCDLALLFPDIVMYNQPKEQVLSGLQRSIRGRKLSNAIDEPFCLATLLSQDPNLVVNADGHEAKMCAFWKAVSGAQQLPVSILFVNGPRIAAVGYRWAVLSLINAEILSEKLWAYNSETNRTNLATVTMQGLRITQCALKLRRPWDLFPHLEQPFPPLQRMGFPTQYQYVRVGPFRWCHLLLEDHSDSKPSKWIFDAISDECICITSSNEVAEDGMAPRGLVCRIRGMFRDSALLESVSPAMVMTSTKHVAAAQELAFGFALDLRDKVNATYQEKVTEADFSLETFSIAMIKALKHIISTRLREGQTFENALKHVGARLDSHHSNFEEFHSLCLAFTVAFIIGWVAEVETVFLENAEWIVD